jgi:prevent-host-death family protein
MNIGVISVSESIFAVPKIIVAKYSYIRYNIQNSSLRQLMEVFMVHIPVSEFKNEISETLNRVVYAGERVALQRHGKDVVALVSMREAAILEDIEKMEDEIDLREALKALKRIRSGISDVVDWEEAKKELDL